MNKKKVFSEVLKLAPEFSCVDGHFYEKPVAHILCGFALGFASAGAYINKFAIPVCDRVTFLHYGFGDRLPPQTCHIDYDSRTEQDFAKEFVSRIHPYRAEWARLSDLGYFIGYVEREFVRPGRLQGSRTLRRAYVTALVMLGRSEQAALDIDLLLATDMLANDLETKADMELLRKKLAESTDAAQDVLRHWESETKRRFAIDTSN